MPYYQGQLMAIPPRLDELVRKGYPARVMNDVIDRINTQALLDTYHIYACRWQDDPYTECYR